MLSFSILYKLEPALYNLRILTEGSLVVVLLIKPNIKLWPAVDEVRSLSIANRLFLALSKQRVSYTSYSFKLGRESSRI